MKTEEVTPAQIARECVDNFDFDSYDGKPIVIGVNAYINATHCPTCGVVTDYDTVPHIALAECGRCARWRDAQSRKARWCAAAYWCTLAGLCVSLGALCAMGR